ncbi:MAG: MoaD/ThiS family protein [Candidatus Bathyarchaeia archaeon]
MRVNVQFFAAARELVGLREETLELPNGGTVKNLLDLLVDRHGQRFREYIFDPKSEELRRSLQVLVGDKPTSVLNGLSTMLTDGCVLAIIPPVGGG